MKKDKIRCRDETEKVLLEEVSSKDSKELDFNNLYSLKTYIMS